MEKKDIKKNNAESKTNYKENAGLEEYRKRLARQREWLEAHPDVKVAYIELPKKKDRDD